MFRNLARLFSSPLRIRIIKFFALQPEHTYTSREVAGLISAPRIEVQREMAALAKLEVLRSTAGRGGVQYEWDSSHPFSSGLSEFLETTTAPTDRVVADAFRRVSSVVAVITAGHLVGEPRSSAELIIIARKPRDPKIALAVRKLEAMTVIPIRYAILEPAEFASRKEAYDRLIRDVLDFKHRIAFGRMPTL